MYILWYLYSYNCISLNYCNRTNTHIIVNMSTICTLIIVSMHILKTMTNLKSLYYEDKEMQNILMLEKVETI